MSGSDRRAARLVHLGLGSNLGDRWRHLASALAALVELDPLLVVSSVYETVPVGGPAGQAPYLNAVVAMLYEGSPHQLLDLAHELEDGAERVRLEHWGPRTLDVDLLFFAGETSSEAELVLPHPRALQRAFVLAPLEEVAPALVPPNWRDALGGAAAVEREVRRVGAIVPARSVPTGSVATGADPSQSIAGGA